jgi:Lipase
MPKLEDLKIMDMFCGEFVDVIHTNGDMNPRAFHLTKTAPKLGYLGRMGTVDFYPNGGAVQPNSNFVGSHEKAISYYLFTILFKKEFPSVVKYICEVRFKF